MKKDFNENRWYITWYIIIVLSVFIGFVCAVHFNLNRYDGKLLIAIVGLIVALIFVIIDKIRKKFQ